MFLTIVHNNIFLIYNSKLNTQVYNLSILFELLLKFEQLTAKITYIKYH